MKETQTQRTPGAYRIADILLGDQDKLETQYGKKTPEGLADLIDRETAAPELIAACKNFSEFSFAAEESKSDYATALREFCRLKRAARAALQKAKGE